MRVYKVWYSERGMNELRVSNIRAKEERGIPRIFVVLVKKYQRQSSRKRNVKWWVSDFPYLTLVCVGMRGTWLCIIPFECLSPN